MKKLILSTVLTIGTAAQVLAQGTIAFENSTSTGNITLNSPSGPLAGSVSVPVGGTTWQVALLWAAGTSPVPQSSLTQLVVFTGNNQGYFIDGTTVTTPDATVPQTSAIFEVQGWTGNFASYADAMAGGAYVGQTAEFVNETGGGVGIQLPAAAVPIVQGWDGNMVLLAPEPSSIALGGLGAAALWLFRRRK